MLTRPGLVMMTNQMADGLIDVAVGVTIIKQIWRRLYDQYHKVRWKAKSILFQELFSLRQSECEDTDSNIPKFQAFYLHLSNMGRKQGYWILIYILFSGLSDEQMSWASTVQNSSRKDVEPLKFSTITPQLLDKSRIWAKSSAGTYATIALIGKQFGKRKSNSTISITKGCSTKRLSFCSKRNFRKAGYNKATVKCSPLNRSYHSVEDCWFLHLDKARVSWLAHNQAESAEQLINLLTIGTLPSYLAKSTPSLPTQPIVLPPAEQSTFLSDTLVSQSSEISFTILEDNKLMPIGTRNLSRISFEGILELDMDLLDTFSQEETICSNENF